MHTGLHEYESPDTDSLFAHGPKDIGSHVMEASRGCLCMVGVPAVVDGRIVPASHMCA